MNLKDRLEKLEKQAEHKDVKQIWFIVHYDGQPELSRAEIEQRIAEYKKKHPDWETQTFITIDTNESLQDLN